jgi:hypothetical protein
MNHISAEDLKLLEEKINDANSGTKSDAKFSFGVNGV